MGRVRILDAALVDRIAAGEVVERPASVVKELIENALDAGASRVDVAIEEGGKRRIQVADDGEGILPEDLPLVFRSHATSKLASDEDLQRIRTFGFRGEALASIGSVARVRIVSRPRGHPAGAHIECASGRIGEVRPAGAPEGTVVEVGHLFHAVPARRKFLRSAEVEAEHVREAVARFAIAFPEVAFSFARDGAKDWTFPAAQDARERLALIYGTDLAEALMEVDGSVRSVRWRAWIAPPAFSRVSARAMTFFVNRRFVRDRILARAVAEAYRDFLPPGRTPVVFVFLEMPPEEVDVNVHPTKIEVRFRQAWDIHDSMVDGMRRRLAAADQARPLPVGRWMERATPGPGPEQEIAAAFAPAAAAQEPAPAPPVSAPPIVKAGHRFFQVHQRYLIEETEDGIRIIDQHGLHERILYEELKREFSRGMIAAQRLLVPAVVRVGPGRMALLEEYRALLEAVGITFDEFGPEQVAVRTVPALLSYEDPARILEDFLDRAQEAESGSARAEAARFTTIEETLEFLACRAAVRFGREMPAEEVERLLARRPEVDHAQACAHGRPIAVKITIEELDRIFLRK